ncbi:MAG TPA: alpha/beta fold hydrolase [Acidimicrobiales bacterium]|nr:alpha/beta fold hydrolase [Acidimicrobiales bacterium]
MARLAFGYNQDLIHRDELSRDIVTGWLRKYVIAPKYLPSQREWLTTDDGVRLRAYRVTPRAAARVAVVLVHGFAGWSRTPAIHAMAHALARYGVEVIVPELRGHGRSRGRCTLGADEARDVDAAVRAARPDLPIITFGVSLGAAACVLHAGTYGGVAACIAVSGPARWTGAGHRASAARVGQSADSRFRRAMLATLVRTRIAPHRAPATPPEDVVGNIAPSLTVIVHDPDDNYFDATHATALYEAARQPKQLWWYAGRGHGVDLFDPALAHRVSELIDDLLAPQPSGSGVELLGHEETAGPLGARIAVHDLPEAGPVAGLDEVRQLVHDHVVDDPGRVVHERRGETDTAVVDGAGPPA